MFGFSSFGFDGLGLHLRLRFGATQRLKVGVTVRLCIGLPLIVQAEPRVYLRGVSRG